MRLLFARRSIMLANVGRRTKKTTPGSASGAAERGVKPTEVADR